MLLSNGSWSDRKIAVIRIRAKILDAARSWFKRHDYVEVQGPIIIPAVGEWRNHFEVRYFDRRSYLARGLQTYAEVLMANMGKIYTIGPTFRAENVVTHRHLTEYWRIESGIPHSDLKDLTKVQEELVTYICQSLSEEAEEELRNTQRDFGELRRIQTPFARLTYDEAVGMLQKDGFDIQWGAILDWQHERHLSLRFSQPFFVSDYPIGVDTFFYKSHPRRPGVTLSVDLLAPEGYGEISTGGQPAIKREELKRKMDEEGIGLKEQKWRISLMGSGPVPYSGFAIGLERLTQWVCKLEDIKETSAFPRTAVNIYP